MPELMWTSRTIKHGRTSIRYLPGETHALYGVGRENLKTGEIEYINEHSFSMSWEKDTARCWPNPPEIAESLHEPGYRSFIINFRKKKHGMKSRRRVSKYNDEITFNETTAT